jgi:hypothetical protein
MHQKNKRVHPKFAQIVLRRDKEDKGDSTETKKDICKNGMLPTQNQVSEATLIVTKIHCR